MIEPILATSSVFMYTCERDPTDSEPEILSQLLDPKCFVLWRNTLSFDLFYLKSALEMTPDVVLTWEKFNASV